MRALIWCKYIVYIFFSKFYDPLLLQLCKIKQQQVLIVQNVFACKLQRLQNGCQYFDIWCKDFISRYFFCAYHIWKLLTSTNIKLAPKVKMLLFWAYAVSCNAVGVVSSSDLVRLVDVVDNGGWILALVQNKCLHHERNIEIC